MKYLERPLQTITLLSITTLVTACGGGGTSDTPPGTAGGGAGSAPTVSLSASPTSLTTTGSSTLTWTSTNATSCTASGGWSGAKATSGSESITNIASTTTYSMICTGAGGSSPAQSVVVTVTAAPATPTATISANPSTVASGGASTLTWSSTNATACTATGGWTGAKAASGTQAINNITATTTYSIACSGTGGTSSTQNAVVTVTAAAAPTVTLTATPTSIATGGMSSLTWTSSNATSCTASSTTGGGWSGSKATSGTESVGPLAASATFTLTCVGSGGSNNSSANVVVTGGGGSSITGAVDSINIDLNGTNNVKIYSGSTATGTPVVTAPVVQDENACTFSYASGALTPGTYTVAFTSDGTTLVGTSTVSVGSSALTKNFTAPTILRVGPGKTYSTIAAAANAATSGAVIEVDAGTYNDDVITWRTNNLVVRGVGGLAHVHGTTGISNGKGLWVTQSSKLRVENIEFSGATVSDENGAGIRGEGTNLTVCGSSFHDNENGILADDAGTLTVEYSTFANNGFGDGFTHNLYIGASTPKFIFRHNYSHHAKIGHTLKTRAKENYILYNRIMDEVTGTSSYTIDVPNGGLTYVIGNLLQQGVNTDNSIIVAYGQEGLSSGRTHNFYLINNTIVNDDVSGTFVASNGSTATFYSANNLFVGTGTLYNGKQPTTALTNLQSSSPGLVDRVNFDYHLLTSSPAKNAGSAVGTGDGFALSPAFEYLHPAKRTARTTDTTLDIGAYEFH